jgi:integrase
MRWLAEEGIGDGATVRQRTPPSRRVDVLDREDVHALVRAARTERDAVIVQLLADSAMRPGELVSLRGRDLKKDSRRFWVTVRGKSGERDVPVAKDLWTRLGRLGAKDDPERALFIGLRRDPRTGEREALTPNGVLQLVQGLGKDCGLKQNVTPYVFRHSGCRWMLLNGMSTVAVAQIMGHGSERMIRLHYANLGRNDSYDQLIGLLKDHG